MININFNLGEQDPLLDEARRLIKESGRTSATLLQRKLDIGFVRATRIIEQLSAMEKPAGDFSPEEPSVRPGIPLLDSEEEGPHTLTMNGLKNIFDKLGSVLSGNGIKVSDIKAVFGPTYTLFKVFPSPGTKVSRVKALSEELEMGIGLGSVRIVTLEDCIGIEVPNIDRKRVKFRELIECKKGQESKMELPLFLGMDVYEHPVAVDLAKAPQILVAGAAGQGKSKIVDEMLCSLLFFKKRKDVKFALIDSKGDMAQWRSLPEDMFFTTSANALGTLVDLHRELESRYEKLAAAKEKNIAGYCKNGGVMPYIICVIDDFAEYTIDRRDVFKEITFLASKGRAVGIHLILTTQRPAVDVITGIIKANFPTRIAVRTTSSVDSRVILDMPGAEKLLGEGDSLLSDGVSIIRAQAANLSEQEIEKVVQFFKEQ